MIIDFPRISPPTIRIFPTKRGRKATGDIRDGKFQPSHNVWNFPNYFGNCSLAV